MPTLPLVENAIKEYLADNTSPAPVAELAEVIRPILETSVEDPAVTVRRIAQGVEGLRLDEGNDTVHVASGRSL